VKRPGRIALAALSVMLVALLLPGVEHAAAQGTGGGTGGGTPGTPAGGTSPTGGFGADEGTSRSSDRDLVTGEHTAPSSETGSTLYQIPGRNSFPLAGPVDPATYRVGPGDLLLLQFWGRMSQSVALEVSPEGTLMVPNGGTVRVDGRTLSDVRDEVLARLKGRFIGVNMDLRLARPRMFRVYATGQVRQPGPMVASGAERVGDLLTAGMFAEGASTRRIELIHTDGSREDCDLQLFLGTGDGRFNPRLQDGDVIQVPSATEQIWAQGAVARPGKYELGVRDSLRTLLRLAGDPLPSADVNKVLLVRFTDPFRPDSVWLSLGDIYTRKVNLGLRDGDRLYVYFVPQYHEQREASIVGEVRRPGVYPILEGQTRVSYLVQQAYGFLPSADLSSIRVHRRNPVAGEKDPELDRLLRLSRHELTNSEYENLRTRLSGLREDYRVDWTRVQGNQDLDLLLRDGDIVRVERLVSSIRVDGEVRRPGIVNFAAGARIEDYIDEAGGFTDRAWRGKVRVTRAVTGQTLLARNVKRLDPGDFVWVPEKPDVTVWEQAKDVLTALASVATIVIAIRSVR
jgi:protein involved in polysaccharide export with SLBB domain